MENLYFNSAYADSSKCHVCVCSFLLVVSGYQASFVFVCAVNVLLFYVSSTHVLSTSPTFVITFPALMCFTR